MKSFWVGWLIVLIACLGMTFLASCDDDDDDSDTDSVDDDATDDDAADDDASDDDAADDDDDDSSPGDVWVDTTTGLTWQNGNQNTLTWQEALSYCSELSWGGSSNWRLPTISELRTLIRGCDATAPGGSCTVTDSCLSYASCWNETCWSCDEGEGPSNGIFWPAELIGTGGWYWSASESIDYPGWAWAIPFYGGDIDGYDETLTVYVRCVQ